MKLYEDFTEDIGSKQSAYKKHSVPDSFIVHGEYNHADNINRWKDILNEEILLPKWNTIIGRNKDMLTGFAAIGTNDFIQTGYCGGLSSLLNYGDILIVTEAKMEDGVSNANMPDCNSVKSDEELTAKAVDYCHNKKRYKYVTGSVLSTSTPFLETEKIVQSWSFDGHIGVDI